MIALDTNVLSELLRVAPAPAVEVWLAAQNRVNPNIHVMKGNNHPQSLFTKSEDLSYTRRYIQFLEGMAWGMERTSATRNGRFWRLFWSRGKRGVRASML